MDVAKIGSVSSKQVDWRKLTAKEIIKYDNEGVNVPIEYLQWAKEFLKDVSSSDNDETTYERATMAVDSTKSTDNLEEDENAQSTEATAEDENSSSDETLSPAEAKRQQLENNGVSIEKQAKLFTKESKRAGNRASIAKIAIKGVESNSNKEIQTLDTHMKMIIAKVDSTQSALKTELENVGKRQQGTLSFAKINKLQKELEKYGQKGQAALAKAGADFDNYEISLSDKSDVIFTASDTGTVTVGIGQEMLPTGDIFSRMRATKAISAGNKAISKSEDAQTSLDSATDVNSQNKSAVNDYVNQIEQKTGVEGLSKSDEDKQKDNNSNSSENSKGEKVSETEKAATGNIDEILKSKIRKGEDTNPTA